jgi:ribosomal protein S18
MTVTWRFFRLVRHVAIRSPGVRQVQLTLNGLSFSLQNVHMLSQFVTDHSGMILPRTLTGMAPGVCSARCAPVHAPLPSIPHPPFARSVTSVGVCAKQQRKLAKAIKRSRAVGMVARDIIMPAHVRPCPVWLCINPPPYPPSPSPRAGLMPYTYKLERYRGVLSVI